MNHSQQMAIFDVPQDAIPCAASIKQLRTLVSADISFRSMTLTDHNWVYDRLDEGVDPSKLFFEYDAALQSGKSYLVGDEWPMSEFLASYRNRCKTWQTAIAAFCWDNQRTTVEVDQENYYWKFYRRGEYVEFALPYHDKGGERNWIAKPPFDFRVLVNMD